MEEKKKVSKYYNPYPFLVRVLNDLKKPQLLAPQAHCKVKGGKYDQSLLVLVPVDKRGERIYSTGMKIELRRLSKEDLVNLAWAVLVADSREDIELLPVKELIEIIKEKTGEKPSEEEEEKPPETLEEKVEVVTQEPEGTGDGKASEQSSTTDGVDPTTGLPGSPVGDSDTSQDEEQPVVVEEKPEKKKSTSRRKRIEIQEEE